MQPNRSHDSNLSWLSLDDDDHKLLDRILRNEADMAYLRRARILLDYLELQDGDRVIDLGCGMGFYLMAMEKLRRLRLIGLDGETERLQRAKMECSTPGLSSGDIHQLPFADGAFDKVLISEVLEHLTDDSAGLRQIYRILKPGGILSISVPHTNYPFWWDPINRIWTGLGGRPFRSGPIVGIWSNHVRLYLPDQLVKVVKESGFQIEILEETTHFSFPFIHFLVYGIGKPLLERNLLPGGLVKSADRFKGEQSSDSLLNPVHLGLAVFRTIDQLNERSAVAKKNSFVNVLIKARKPTA